MPTPPQPETLDSKLIYRSRWVNLFVDRVRFPNGSIIEQHHKLDFDHEAVMAIPCGADGRCLLVQVCRYPTGRTEWEFPAGSVETGEDVLEAARREVQEETGYDSNQYERLYTYHPLNGIANQVFHVVRCQVSGPAGVYDEKEISGVRWFTRAEIWDLIRSGEMMDGYTLTAFLLDEKL